MKRVVGLPGDAITLHQGLALVHDTPFPDGDAVFEPAETDLYRDEFPRYTTGDPSVDPSWRREMRGLVENGQLRVPDAQYFVLGDNRNHSRDSRYWGFVPRDHIVGTPLLIYFSLREPSATDPGVDGRLGNSVASGPLAFARWNRVLQIVH